MSNLTLQIKKLVPEAVTPAYAHPGDAGLDLCAAEAVVIPARSRERVRTGLALAIPPESVGLVWDKSGLAYNQGITCLAGVVDAGYRGEVLVVLYNTTDSDWSVAQGQKIAQLLIQPIERPTIAVVDELSETARGDGGFGSTGL